MKKEKFSERHPLLAAVLIVLALLIGTVLLFLLGLFGFSFSFSLHQTH